MQSQCCGVGTSPSSQDVDQEEIDGKETGDFHAGWTGECLNDIYFEMFTETPEGDSFLVRH